MSLQEEDENVVTNGMGGTSLQGEDENAVTGDDENVVTGL